MAKFLDVLAELKNSVQNLVNDTNVNEIAKIAKTCDSLESEYKTVEKEKQEAKDSLVRYVKEYAFKEKEEDKTGIDLPPSLDDAIEDAFKDLK